MSGMPRQQLERVTPGRRGTPLRIVPVDNGHHLPAHQHRRRLGIRRCSTRTGHDRARVPGHDRATDDAGLAVRHQFDMTGLDLVERRPETNKMPPTHTVSLDREHRRSRRLVPDQFG
jgi:hypothetical protein